VSTNPYQAKNHYQDSGVASSYDRDRFIRWHGKMAHQAETKALMTAVSRYFDGPGKLLDLPCGTGRLLGPLLDRGFEITGGDISEAMLKEARSRFQNRPGITFRIMNAESLPFEDNAFDYLTSYRLMCHLPPAVREKVLSEMIRVTRKVLVINYHFAAASPLYLFNKLFRKINLSPYPLKESGLRHALDARRDADLLEIRKLSWYERSSALVILKKKPPIS